MSAKYMGLSWDLDLPHNQLLVLLAMTDHADHLGNNIRPSLGLIAWKTGYSEQQVRRIIRQLVAMNILIVVENEAGKAIKYSVNLDAGTKKKEYVAPKREPMTKWNPLHFDTPDTSSLKMNAEPKDSIQEIGVPISVAATPTTATSEISSEPTCANSAPVQAQLFASEPNLPKKASPYKAIVTTATEAEVVVGDEKPNKTKGGRKRAEGVTPAECINPMKAAIMKAFGWSWKTATTHEKGQVNAAAKQLYDCNFPVEQIPDLHKHCAEKFEQFGPMALTTNQSEFRKEHKPKQIAPELLAPQKKVIPAPVRSAIQEGWEAVKKYKIDLEFWGVDPSEVGMVATS